jgi:hypothetical protein
LALGATGLLLRKRWAKDLLIATPLFLTRDLVVFMVLALIIAFGFFYIRRNYRAG